MVELLAPAGSREALTAAVENGADAVYLAGSRFGARAYAENFDEAAMREAIRYAHLRGVAVHVTVNTAVDDTELSGLADYLRFLEEAGADAVLVQDLGVARLAREVAPGLPLHASTQMTVHNIEGVRALEEGGLRAACIDAVTKSYLRTKELGK
ncbi:MAG: U32 family peptidase, partial [Schwartzia sp.]|nr:U32 family peptidase [Schwartzia sp. (in: firmicutes)]